MQVNIGGESTTLMRDTSIRHTMELQEIIESTNPTYDAIVSGAYALSMPPDTHIMHLGNFESLERRIGSNY